MVRSALYACVVYRLSAYDDLAVGAVGLAGAAVGGVVVTGLATGRAGAGAAAAVAVAIAVGAAGLDGSR